MMHLYVITPETFPEGEADVIAALLRGGIDRVHLRKPHSREEEMRRLFEAIPANLHRRLTLQDHLHLASEYGVGGVQLNSRNPQPPAAGRRPARAAPDAARPGLRRSRPAGVHLARRLLSRAARDAATDSTIQQTIDRTKRYAAIHHTP